ncbi:superinfection immunity protein [Acidithiobacillus caldus]
MYPNEFVTFLEGLSGAVILAIIVVYFIPTAVALSRGSRYLAPVIVINVFSGWTVFGWVAAFALAVWPEEEQSQKRAEPKISQKE